MHRKSPETLVEFRLGRFVIGKDPLAEEAKKILAAFVGAIPVTRAEPSAEEERSVLGRILGSSGGTVKVKNVEMGELVLKEASVSVSKDGKFTLKWRLAGHRTDDNAQLAAVAAAEGAAIRELDRSIG